MYDKVSPTPLGEQAVADIEETIASLKDGVGKQHNEGAENTLKDMIKRLEDKLDGKCWAK